MKNYTILGIIALLIFFFGALFGSFVTPSCDDPVTLSRTEVVTRDTIKAKTPAPVVDKVARVDVVRLPLAAKKKKAKTDQLASTPPTVQQDSAEVVVPISTKVYQTNDYRAVVSGFRVKLDSMEVYRDTKTITEIQQIKPRRKWLALTVGPSVGYDINGQVVPSLSVTLGLILLSK